MSEATEEKTIDQQITEAEAECYRVSTAHSDFVKAVQAESQKIQLKDREMMAQVAIAEARLNELRVKKAQQDAAAAAPAAK